MTSTIEQKEAYSKMQEINKVYCSFKELCNSDYVVWWKKLYALQIDLCDSPFWSELMETMEYVKSQRTY